MEETKTLLIIAVIAVAALVGLLFLADSTTTGMLSGQQKIPYSYVYGPQEYKNLCAFVKCPNGATGMPIGIERYSGRVYCRCPEAPIPYNEMPAYVKVGV